MGMRLEKTGRDVKRVIALGCAAPISAPGRMPPRARRSPPNRRAHPFRFPSALSAAVYARGRRIAEN
jgi:hypothetical protein